MADLISRAAILKRIEKIRQGALMMDDIKRIRRELMDLAKMLDPWRR